MVATESDHHEKTSDPISKPETESPHDLADLDPANTKAYKGDDSDGKFQWGFRNWLAAGSLAMLYTGTKVP